MKNIFNSIFLHFYFFFFLADKENKCVIRKIMYVCKNLLNLDSKDSIRFGISKLPKDEESFGKSFSFPFSSKCFDRNSKCFFSKLLNFVSYTLPFLNTIKFKIFKTYYKTYFLSLFLKKPKRGGICILKAYL